MGFWKKLFIFSELCKFQLLFLLLGLAIFYMGTYSHEMAHKQIFEYHGVNSTLHMGWLESYVTPIDYSKCDEACWFAQDMVEAIGYQLGWIWMLLFVGILIGIMILEGKYFLYKVEQGLIDYE